MYLDASVVIDYWVTEGLEIAETEAGEFEKDELPVLPVVREILKSEKRTAKVVEIRKKIFFGGPRVTPVVSPLALLELMEWNAEAAFQQLASVASGARLIKSKGKKDVGDYLKQALRLRRLEVEEVKARKGKGETLSTGLEMLMSETWLNRSFAAAHGLKGLLAVDIVDFHLPMSKVWAEPSAYAYLQLGLADIMHILVAQHLGCEYIASFDSDFKRVKDIVKDEIGISVLTSPEEVLAVL